MSILPTSIPTSVWKGRYCKCGKRLTTSESRRVGRCHPCDRNHKANLRKDPLHAKFDGITNRKGGMEE